MEPGTFSDKSRAFYLQHHVYGEHQFLIPCKVEPIERYEAMCGMRCLSGMVGGDPTTSVYQENLQLLPCTRENLDIFLEKLQSQPFYISVKKGMFQLHVKDTSGSYRRLYAQNYSPRRWAGFAHPVITLQYDRGSRHVHRLEEIDWVEIAEQLGMRQSERLGTEEA